MAPVKGLRLAAVRALEFGRHGVAGDRRFYLVDDEGAMINAKRAPRLLSVQAAVDGTLLVLTLPDGELVAGDVELGEPLETSFFGRPVAGRFVRGTWNEALSEVAGFPLRLARTERDGDGLDRGRGAGASLVSTSSLAALGTAAGADEPVDGRRFRMTIGVEGTAPHTEDAWLGRPVRVGGAVVVPRGNVGRCAVTTLDPDRGVRTLDTLGALAEYRRDVPTTEPLPFGVWCEVVEPGLVAVGDAVVPN
jgi:uncharacterized protein YcbX